MARLALGSLLVVMCFASQLASAQDCPAMGGYQFYLLQGIVNGYVIKRYDAASVAAMTPFQLAAACDGIPRCNAFTTAGAFLIAPAEPLFEVLDASSPETKPCDGLYLAPDRTFSGFKFPEGVTPADVEAKGRATGKGMVAATAAAARVAAQLRKAGKDPKDAKKMNPAELKKAFDDAKVPQAQSDPASGAYTLADVLVGLTAPTYDSRTPDNGYGTFITPVRDQGGCGSCVAFAGTTVAESAVLAGIARANKSAEIALTQSTIDLSEQWMFFCNNYVGDCAKGWYPGNAAAVATQYNLPTEANYPYKAAPNCTLMRAPEERTPGTFSSITYYDIASAKQHIMDWGAVMTYFTVYSDFYSWSASKPPYVYDGVSAYRGGHEVAVVGWNDTGAYWLVKNSWGSWWGDKGYFRIAYGQVGIMSGSGSNIIGMKWTPSGYVPPSPSPEPVVCGDGTCDASESCSSCAADCGACVVCGDGTCNGGEDCSSCAKDCGACCGDGSCSAARGENCATCPQDCNACPTCIDDGVCNLAAGERCWDGAHGCRTECGSCGSAVCGDGVCSSSKNGYTESCLSCPGDCGVCADKTNGYCGDGMCQAARKETATSCARDCKGGGGGKPRLGVPFTSGGKKRSGRRLLRAASH